MKISFDIDDRIVAVAARVWRIARHRITHASFGLFVLVGAGALAHAAVVLPHRFSPHERARAEDVNENFDAIVTALDQMQETLGTKKRQTIRLPGSVANRNLAASVNGYFYAHPDRDSWGQVEVSLPVGSVITAMTCYFENRSSVVQSDETYFYGELRELATGDSLELARVTGWPETPGVQALAAEVGGDGIPVRPDQAYFVQFGIVLATGTDTEDYYLGPDVEDRLLRHYGCRLDYEAPSLAASQAAQGG